MPRAHVPQQEEPVQCEAGVALDKEMATHSSVLAWKSQGWRSLVGCRLWGRTESDTTEAT